MGCNLTGIPITVCEWWMTPSSTGHLEQQCASTVRYADMSASEICRIYCPSSVDSQGPVATQSGPPGLKCGQRVWISWRHGVDGEVFIENSVGLAILETANCTGPDDHTLVGTRRYIVLVLCLWRRVRGSSSHPSPFCDAASSPFWLLLRTQQRASRIWTLPLQQLQQQILLGPDPTTMRRLMTRPMWRGQLSRLRRSK